MEVRRDRYLNNLIDRMHNGMIKVITGVRRCGKTYLLFELFGNYLRDELGVGDDRIVEVHWTRRRTGACATRVCLTAT